MSLLAWFGTVALSIAVAFLAVVLIRFNRKRLFVAECTRNASPEQLEHIYTLVEQVGTVPATGYVLARTNQHTRDHRCLVPIPHEISGFPWAGQVVEARVGPKEVEIHFIDATVAEP